ncbi:hypothetical protein QOZ80_9AG0675960 [Eleusine coracana subsp. coracana]|nr:hypothetical protein QOZ80_9AG0675960 [Eleusine coracana subsp. coracana]
MSFFKLLWPWSRAPWFLRHLHVEDGGENTEAESTASKQHRRQLPVPVEEPVHVEEGESAAASVHEVAGSSSEGSSCDGSDGEAVEGGAAGGRGRNRGRRRRRPRRRERTGGGLPAFVAAVGPAAAAMLLALVALVAWKRRYRGGNGGESEVGDDARGVP